MAAECREVRESLACTALCSIFDGRRTDVNQGSRRPDGRVRSTSRRLARALGGAQFAPQDANRLVEAIAKRRGLLEVQRIDTLAGSEVRLDGRHPDEHELVRCGRLNVEAREWDGFRGFHAV